MKLCRLLKTRRQLFLIASKRIALATAIAGFASIANAQTTPASPKSTPVGQANLSQQQQPADISGIPGLRPLSGQPQRLAPIVMASAADGTQPISAGAVACGPSQCTVNSNQPTRLAGSPRFAGSQLVENQGPVHPSNQQRLPMPLMADGAKTHGYVQAAQMVEGTPTSGGGVVSLAVGQGMATTEATGESLIDIEIPIPGVPRSNSVSDQHRYLPQPPVTPPAVVGSFSDDSQTELQASSRRSASPSSRAPELIQRGQPMRISVDSMQPDGQQSERLPASEAASSQPLEFSLSDSSATPVQESLPRTSQPQLAEGPVVVSLNEHGNWDQAALMNQPVALPESVGDSASSMPEQFTQFESLSSDEEAMSQELSSENMQMRLAVDGPQAEHVSPMKLSNSAESTSSRITANSAPAFVDDAPLQLSDMPEALAIDATSETLEESPLATPIDPSQLSMGDEMLVSPEQPVLVKMNQPVLEYSVEHPGICRLIQTSETTLSLIGLQDGDTRIAVVTASGEQERNIEIRGVRVASASAPQGRLQTLAREVTQTIKRLYPYGDVQVVASGEELIVQGYVQAERDARKIVSLVRKTSLTPVIDRLHSMTR